MKYETIIYDIDDRVAIITLNRPERLNSFSLKLREEVVAALARADADPTVRVVILTGAGGKAFSAGYDIRESADFPMQTVGDWRGLLNEQCQFTFSVWRCSKPVIAVIEGYCLAGAMELALMCDIRYCSDDAQFGVIETRFGSGIVTAILPWVLGARSRELIFTGDRFGPDEAYRLGIVNKVFPKADLRAQALKVAKRMSQVAKDCLVGNKRVINNMYEAQGFEVALRYGLEACVVMDSTGSPENDEWNNLRRTKGLKEANQWRDSLFAQYE